MRLVMVLLIASLSCNAETSKPRRRTFWASIAAVGLSAVLDVHSSYGKAEANPVARSADGRLGMRGVSIKLATAGAIVGWELITTRRRPSFERSAAIVNFGLAGAWTGMAVRNYGVRRPPASWSPSSSHPSGSPLNPRLSALISGQDF